MPWTSVAKPGAQTYSNVNPTGREQYDQSDIIYDSTTTFYDGVNPSMWTDVSKPVTPASWVSVSKPV